MRCHYGKLRKSHIGLRTIKCKNIFASLFSIHNTISLSRHEQVCLSGLLFQCCLLLQTLPSSPHLHLQVSCHSMCFVSLFLDIRLNILTFKFLTTSETHSFAYGLLILLQLPLNLLILILKGKNIGSSPLRLTICGLVLHS